MKPVPLPFEGFLLHLQRQGLTVGVDGHLRLRLLLARMNGQYAPGDLKTLLAPIFATSAEQQRAFYSAFETYFAAFVAAEAVAVDETPRPIAQRPPPKQDRKAGWWVLLAGVLVAAAAIGVFTVPSRREPDPARKAAPVVTPEAPGAIAPTPRATPVAPIPSEPESTSWIDDYQRFRALLCFLAAAVPLSAFLLLEWRRRSRRKLALHRQRSRKPPHSWPIRPTEHHPGLHGNEKFYAAARRLNQRQQGDVTALDVERTIQATIDSCGLPSLRYRPTTRPPEYLVLIDRASSRDQQAELFASLAEALRTQGLYVHTYFFDGDPRVCSTENGRPRALVELARGHSDHRLLLLTDGARLTDAITGRPLAWCQAFSQWSERALLTPEPMASWGMREKTLATLFPVLPATLDGLGALVDCLGPEPQSLPAASGELLPDAENVEELRAYLGGTGFAWLCACAVYPELRWQITLHLGMLPELGGNLPGEDDLLRLVRLPWFRAGWMPDELRWSLVSELGPLRERAVRSAIVELLVQSPPPPGSHAAASRDLEIALERQLVDGTVKLLPEEAPADYVLLRALEKAHGSKLAFVLPENFSKIIYRRGTPLFGLRSTARLSVALAAVLTFLSGIAWLDSRLRIAPMEIAPTPGVAAGLRRAAIADPTAIREARDWLALPRADLEALRAFVSAYPSGAHAAEARARVEILVREEAAWQTVQSASDGVVVQGFIRQFADGKYAGEARKLLARIEGEENTWAGIQRSRDAKSIEAYLLTFPNGRYAAEARGLSGQLAAAAEAEYRRALNSKDPAVMEKYVQAQSDSTHLSEARAKIAEWTILRDWDQVKTQPDIAALEAFRKKHPGSAHDPEAVRLIDSIQSEQARLRVDREWQAARSGRDPAEIRLFLDRYRNSLFEAEARQLLNEISREEALREMRKSDTKPEPGPPAARSGKDGLLYIRIPPGAFLMGCTPADRACRGEELRSQSQVTLPPFYIGQTEVTVAAFRKYGVETKTAMPRNVPWNPRWRIERMPVNNLSAADAEKYCAWLGGRLPTEAEWEYAARGGVIDGLFINGNSASKQHSNFQSAAPMVVASLTPNAFGLFDLTGNVSEYAYAGTQPNSERVMLRGGTFGNGAGEMRLSYRRSWKFTDPASGNGFRCVSH